MGLGAPLAGRRGNACLMDSRQTRHHQTCQGPGIWPGPPCGTDGCRTRRQGRRNRAPDRSSEWHTSPCLSGRARDRPSATRLYPLSPERLWQLWRNGRAGDRRGGRGAGGPAGLSDSRGQEGQGQSRQAHQQGGRRLGRTFRGAPAGPRTSGALRGCRNRAVGLASHGSGGLGLSRRLEHRSRSRARKGHGDHRTRWRRARQQGRGPDTACRKQSRCARDHRSDGHPARRRGFQ